MSDLDEIYDDSLQAPDEVQVEAREYLRRFFDQNREMVYFSRQLEVQNENDYFHWITNRAIHEIEGEGSIKSEWRKLKTGTALKLIWHKSYRFYKRSANQLVTLVEEYSDPNIGGSLDCMGRLWCWRGLLGLNS